MMLASTKEPAEEGPTEETFKGRFFPSAISWSRVRIGESPFTNRKRGAVVIFAR